MKPKSVVLKGGAIAVLDTVANVMKLYEEDGFDGVYIPPRMVRISGRSDLLQLRDLLNEAFPPEELVAAAQALERAVLERVDHDE
ncbi:hypothetical protein [Gorillibacterium sp. sgz5001074]|uniref:hypothetical protein n=1 Tax=Gorillibacterium sp. sgz5001074 TaxID=3446695 RepID=UPI003F66FC69